MSNMLCQFSLLFRLPIKVRRAHTVLPTAVDNIHETKTLVECREKGRRRCGRERPTATGSKGCKLRYTDVVHWKQGLFEYCLQSDHERAALPEVERGLMLVHWWGVERSTTTHSGTKSREVPRKKKKTPPQVTSDRDTAFDTAVCKKKRTLTSSTVSPHALLGSKNICQPEKGQRTSLAITTHAGVSEHGMGSPQLPCHRKLTSELYEADAFSCKQQPGEECACEPVAPSDRFSLIDSQTEP